MCCLYSSKNFDKNTPDSACLVTQSASIWPTHGSINTCKQCFFGPWPCTKSTEFLASGFAQLPKTRASDKFLNTFYKYSQRGKSLLKANSKLPQPFPCHFMGGQKTTKKSTRKPNKKAKLGACKEGNWENMEVGRISLPHTCYIVKMGTTVLLSTAQGGSDLNYETKLSKQELWHLALIFCHRARYLSDAVSLTPLEEPDSEGCQVQPGKNIS